MHRAKQVLGDFGVRGLVALALLVAVAGCQERLMDYHKPGEFAPLPKGTVSLYKTPWRANVRTASAYEALHGVGVYYKHIPPWTEAEHTLVMEQMAAAGVRRLRIAILHGMYITKDWTAPGEGELRDMRNILRACKAAGIRPCATFCHIPPAGKAGTQELQEWWHRGWNTELLPVGEVGSPEFKAYLDKTYEALVFLLREARDAGFTQPESWDLELCQSMWWGAPATSTPWPSTTLNDLQPGGRFYEFGRDLILRLRKDKFVSPTVWWAYTHHLFDDCTDSEVPPEAAGRAISFYSQGIGLSTSDWLAQSKDTWPVRPEHMFLEGDPPDLVLARPEGWMADRTRHENMIDLINTSKTPVAVTSLGTVPSAIHNAKAHGLNGWQIKQRALTRSLAFWLNQGSPFVLLHSAYEGADDDMSHALIPEIKDIGKFKWQDAPPLVTMQAFCGALAGARPLKKPDELNFRYAVDPDPVLVPATGDAGPLRASDAVTLLPFQIDLKKFAVAAYVMTPNIAKPMSPAKMTLEIDKKINGGASILRPYTQHESQARILKQNDNATTVEFDIADDVTWLVFEAE